MPFEKNQPTGFGFTMIDATTRAPKPSVAVSGKVSADGGAFANVAGAVTETGYGGYYLAPNAADWSGNAKTFRFAGSGCQDTLVHVNTEANYTAARAANLDLIALINAVIGKLSGLFAAGNVSAAASAASFTVAFPAPFATPADAAKLRGLTARFLTGTNSLIEAQVAGAAQGSDANHVVVSFAAGSFANTPSTLAGGDGVAFY